MSAFGTDDLLAVLDHAAAWLNEGKRVAPATLVQTWGSSPRPVASQMAIAEDGGFEGSVSGGVEGAVIETSHTAMRDGKPRLQTFGVTALTVTSLMVFAAHTQGEEASRPAWPAAAVSTSNLIKPDNLAWNT